MCQYNVRLYILWFTICVFLISIHKCVWYCDCISDYDDEKLSGETVDLTGNKLHEVDEQSRSTTTVLDGTNVDEDTDDSDNRWCQYNSGPATIADHRAGRRHDVYISLRRDGSVWVRVGNGQLDLATINERRRRIQASVLDDSAVEALRFLLSRRQQQQNQQRLRWQAKLRQIRMNSTTSSTASFDWSSSSSTVVDRCALTDIELSLTVVGGWNPSYVAVFDADAGRGGRNNFESRIFSIRNTRDDCQTSASINLSANKQTIRCDGGSLLRGSMNVCSQRLVPERNAVVAQMTTLGSSAGSGTLSSQGVQSHPAVSTSGGVPPTGRFGSDMSPTWFIKYISMDPNGTDHWYCRQHEGHNRFSLVGSYYYAYVRVATCPPPVG